MKSREDSPANPVPPSLVQEHCFVCLFVCVFVCFFVFFFLKNHGFSILTFLANFSIQKFTPYIMLLAGISPWDLWIRIKRKKLV